MLALCKAGPLLDNVESAERLLLQILIYMPEAHVQLFASSPFLRSIQPSPWEALSYDLTTAALAIGRKHPSLHDLALDCTIQYLRSCMHTVSGISKIQIQDGELLSGAGLDETLELAATSVSLLGFLEATSIYTDFYSVTERLELVSMLRQIFTEDFMVSVEGVFSSIRTSEAVYYNIRDWKSFTKRYAVSGRPLGAMLLQRGFMRLLVSCSSLQVFSTDQLQQTDIFDVLTSDEDIPHIEIRETDSALLEVLSEIAVEEMRLLEDGADYLQLGSAWQQRLAFAVKANILITFLNCMVADEEIADADVLILWLEDTMADPVQMADDTLACVVLRSMTVVAKLFPSIASSLSRSLPRFIVKGGIRDCTVTVAARCLTYILQLLSQDATITGLYSLGNALSAGSSTEKNIVSSVFQNSNQNGPRNSTRYTQQSSGSAISLQLNGEEETAAVYGNIVRAIITIARTCQDDKISALAQSMLLQKLGKVSTAVDIQIITEAAALGTSGGPLEFKSLLKLYVRFTHEAVVQGNSAVLEAVNVFAYHYETIS